MIFPKLEMTRSKRTFEKRNELETYLKNELDTHSPEIMHHELQMLIPHCQTRFFPDQYILLKNSIKNVYDGTLKVCPDFAL